MAKLLNKKVPRLNTPQNNSDFRPIAKSYGFEDLLSNLSATFAEEDSKPTKNKTHHLQNLHSKLQTSIVEQKATILTVERSFVFAYWRVSSALLRQGFAQQGPKAQITLRFYDISKTNLLNNCTNWDIDVFDQEGNWYLKLEHPKQQLCFEVGLKDSHNEFYQLCQSNVIELSAESKRWWNRKSTPKTTANNEETIRQTLGPHFFELFKTGQLANISQSSLTAMFQEVSCIKPL